MSKAERSLEQVHYDLGGVHGLDENSKTYIRLLETLQRLPNHIYEFAIKNILFVCAESSAIPINQIRILKKKYLIIIRNLSHFGIAHEIAHAKLNHKMFWKSQPKQEDEANELATSWGFKKHE